MMSLSRLCARKVRHEDEHRVADLAHGREIMTVSKGTLAGRAD
jgi:hypothetical protein